jgi:uncharacterized RDD family membrane protein YckC
MTTFYYIALEGKNEGPFTAEEILSNSFSPDTPVWSYAQNRWIKLKDFPELQQNFAALPPPPPAATYTGTNALPGDKYFGYRLASKWERLFGAILQVLVLVPVIMIIYLPGFFLMGYRNHYEFTLTPQVDFVQGIALSSLGFFVTFTAAMISYPYFSGNFGHKIMNLKVISAKDGSDYNSIAQGALRECTKQIFGSGYILNLWLLFNKDNLNLYDRICKTYVVKKNY